jgi:hypothetical protein
MGVEREDLSEGLQMGTVSPATEICTYFIIIF